MPDIFCACLYKAVINIPVSLWSTVLEFLFSVIISVCGEIFNYRFMTKLKEEKRKTPIGRKGNVIEPIMRWYLQTSNDLLAVSTFNDLGYVQRDHSIRIHEWLVVLCCICDSSKIWPYLHLLEFTIRCSD
jgi:hypothetical protein